MVHLCTDVKYRVILFYSVNEPLCIGMGRLLLELTLGSQNLVA